MLADAFNNVAAVDMTTRDALEPLLLRAFEAATVMWPEVTLSADSFVRYIAARVPHGGDVCDDVGKLHTSDLFLSAACLQGDRAALKYFDERLLSGLGGARFDAELCDEARQELRIKLLSGDGERLPRLSEYSGKGALRAWLMVGMTRTTLNLLRKTAPEQSLSDGLKAVLEAPGDSPEATSIKGQWDAALHQAVREAFGRLEKRQRNLLRQHLLDGLTAIELGVLYRVHRVTIGHWLEDARVQLLKQVKARLLPGSDGTATLLSSHVEWSLRGALMSDRSVLRTKS